jgi:hypothetical protein
MALDPIFHVGEFKDAENHAGVIPSGLDDIFNLKSTEVI